MPFPSDPFILFSVLNTQLRDKYASLDELCEDVGYNKEDVLSALSAIDYVYNPQKNQFIQEIQR